jgi:hypothetical protein
MVRLAILRVAGLWTVRLADKVQVPLSQSVSTVMVIGDEMVAGIGVAPASGRTSGSTERHMTRTRATDIRPFALPLLVWTIFSDIFSPIVVQFILYWFLKKFKFTIFQYFGIGFDDLIPFFSFKKEDGGRLTVGPPMVSIYTMFANYQTISFDIYTKGCNNENVDQSSVMMEGM